MAENRSGAARIGSLRCVRVPAAALAALVLVVAGCGTSTVRGSPGGLVPVGAGLNGPPGLTATVYAKGPATLSAFAFATFEFSVVRASANGFMDAVREEGTPPRVL